VIRALLAPPMAAAEARGTDEASTLGKRVCP
jgi:hypothetical protein